MSVRLEYVGDVRGNRSDPLEIRIVCSCAAPLGRLGLLTKRPDGLRKTICENCGFVVAIDDRGQIVLHAAAPPELLRAHGIEPLRLSRDVVSSIDLRKLDERR